MIDAATIVGGKAREQVCLDDEKARDERYETAISVGSGGRRSVLPEPIDFGIAVKGQIGYSDGRNRRSSGQCRLIHMPLSTDDLVALINEEVSRWRRVGDGVAAVRHSALLQLRDVLQSAGFAKDRNQRRELSLVPFVFQEANYDDIDWTDRAAPLGHLSGIFAIDVAVQSGGRERHELTDGEYDKYVQVSFAAIDYRQKRH